MTNDDLDRILSSKDDDILPSSGLVASVMGTVRSEAAMPPPIPFPWKRALPGLASAAFVLVCLTIFVLDQLVHRAVAPSPIISLPTWWVPIGQAIGWSVLELLLSLILVKLSVRLASR